MEHNALRAPSGADRTLAKLLQHKRHLLGQQVRLYLLSCQHSTLVTLAMELSVPTDLTPQVSANRYRLMAATETDHRVRATLLQLAREWDDRMDSSGRIDEELG